MSIFGHRRLAHPNLVKSNNQIQIKSCFPTCRDGQSHCFNDGQSHCHQVDMDNVVMSIPI